jgi:hypothetical protein
MRRKLWLCAAALAREARAAGVRTVYRLTLRCASSMRWLVSSLYRPHECPEIVIHVCSRPVRSPHSQQNACAAAAAAPAQRVFRRQQAQSGPACTAAAPPTRLGAAAAAPWPQRLCGGARRRSAGQRGLAPPGALWWFVQG